MTGMVHMRELRVSAQGHVGAANVSLRQNHFARGLPA
jgi:hypothetical protein